MSRVLIVGGGAAGLLAAGTAAQSGADVLVIEHQPRPARKVMITGKGRCNVTNDADLQQLIQNVPRNGRFLYSAFSTFTPQDVRDLLEKHGVPTKVERGNRVFPVSDKAVDVVDALVSFAKSAGAHFLQARVADLLIENGVCSGVVLENGENLKADAVCVCTGGASYSRTGSTGDGFRLASGAGHTVVPIRPSLVPLCIREYDCSQMQGLSLKNCTLSVIDTKTNKTIYKELGEMMFTHFGVTGPLVLSASAHMAEMTPARYRLTLDLKPALSKEQLSDRVVRELNVHKNASVNTMLATLLPKSMIPVVAARSGLSLHKPCHAMTKEERLRLVELLKCFVMTVDGFRSIEEAIVTSGGVCVKEIDAKTMGSKLVDGLYFAGEVLDVDAYTGGFNLQIAFSTGAAAGRAMSQV